MTSKAEGKVKDIVITQLSYFLSVIRCDDLRSVSTLKQLFLGFTEEGAHSFGLPSFSVHEILGTV